MPQRWRWRWSWAAAVLALATGAGSAMEQFLPVPKAQVGLEPGSELCVMTTKSDTFASTSISAANSSGHAREPETANTGQSLSTSSCSNEEPSVNSYQS
jgi:hypothetical protein